MLIIKPIDFRGESRIRLNAQHEKVRELAKTRMSWNVLICLLPAGIWISSLLIRSSFEQGSFVSGAVSIGALILQIAALVTTILVHKRYAKKLEQARTTLHEMTLEHGQIPLEESRETDAA